jgi:hypothetical protein
LAPIRPPATATVGGCLLKRSERPQAQGTVASGPIIGVPIPPLLFGKRRDELAAEGRDVLDHAAPDQVKMGFG